VEPETLTRACRARRLSYVSVGPVQGIAAADSSVESCCAFPFLGNDSRLHVWAPVSEITQSSSPHAELKSASTHRSSAGRLKDDYEDDPLLFLLLLHRRSFQSECCASQPCILYSHSLCPQLESTGSQEVRLHFHGK